MGNMWAVAADAARGDNRTNAPVLPIARRDKFMGCFVRATDRLVSVQRDEAGIDFGRCEVALSTS